MDRPLQDLPQIQIPLTRPQDTGKLKIETASHIKPSSDKNKNITPFPNSSFLLTESDLVLALDSRLYDRQAR